jgi:glycosyltransferase involved in cell wall biosynthesis
MTPLRVLHVHSGNLFGGVEVMLRALAAYHAPAMMVSEFALSFEGEASRVLAEAGAPVHQLGAVRLRDPWSVTRARRALAALLANAACDVCVCHSAWALVVFGRVVLERRLPLVLWLHAASVRHWLDRWAARTIPDLVLCNSRFTCEATRARFPGVPRAVLYPPVSAPPRDEAAGTRTRAAVRTALGTADDALVIVQVGRMEPMKGQALHLEALSRIRDVPGWVCWQVGAPQRAFEARHVADLQRLAARLDIGDRVVFTGARADVPALLAAADVYCQPNLQPETFGLTFIEALAAGLPVISTSLGGAAEIVDDSCGLLVPAADARALADALRRALVEAGLRARLAAGGPARARALCDPSTQVPRLASLLSEAGARRHPAAAAPRVTATT